MHGGRHIKTGGTEIFSETFCDAGLNTAHFFADGDEALFLVKVRRRHFASGRPTSQASAASINHFSRAAGSFAR
jgi:hypothetical protein